MSKNKIIEQPPLTETKPEEVKKEPVELKEHCHYSGLPSVEWYGQNSESNQEIENP